MRRLSIIIISILLFSCKSSKEKTATTIANNTLSITFLDSTAAAKQILQERMDGFFQALSPVEISIQLKSEQKFDSPATALKSYKDYLQTEVYSFTANEQTLMTEVFNEAKRMVDKVNPALWPSNIDLIKTRTNHYGPDVYYTREDAIVIPDNVFTDNRTAEGIMPVMLHEIYHILSRTHKSFRNDTYELIDFYPHGKNVVLPQAIQRKRLTNPDGVTTDYAVKLNDGEGNEKLAMPFLISNQPYFSKNIPSFFAYLNFDLYPLNESGNNNITLGADKAGKTTLSAEHQADYFNHIADNTQYVIHPEEVMADNFMMSIMAYDKDEYEQYSAKGKKLIDEVLIVLKAFKK